MKKLSPQSWYSSLIRGARESYVRAVSSTLSSGKGDWKGFHKALEKALIVSDFLHASRLWWKGTRTPAHVPSNGDVRFIHEKNPWYEEHAKITHPEIQARVEYSASLEKKFYQTRAGSLKSAKLPLVGFRMTMIERNIGYDISQKSEQAALSIPEIGQAFPFVEYLTADDSRVRPTHSAMHGFVALRSWAGWKIILPPCGYNCRCYVIYRTKFHAMREGWMTKDGEPKFKIHWPGSGARINFEHGLFPDDGWDGPKYVAPS